MSVTSHMLSAKTNADISDHSEVFELPMVHVLPSEAQNNKPMPIEAQNNKTMPNEAQSKRNLALVAQNNKTMPIEAQNENDLVTQAIHNLPTAILYKKEKV